MASPFALSAVQGELLCGLCRRLQPPFSKAVAYGSYEGGLRDLLHLLKYEHVRPAANVLGRMLAEVIPHLEGTFATGEILLMPVPLHAGKRRQRGFNQSELIARAALKLLPQGKFKLRANGLVRLRETQSQTGLTSHQRRENLRGAFSVALPRELRGQEVLLVDDVFTTGTTVSECARVLRRAGASRICVATVARTLKADAQRVPLPVATDPRITMAAAG